MRKDRKGIIERLSWTSIIAAIITVLGLYFGVPEYIFNIRPQFVASAGSDIVSFTEGALSGAITIILVLKLFSRKASPQFSGKPLEGESERRLLARGLIAELKLLNKEVRDYRSLHEAPIYTSSGSKLHLFKEETIQNLQSTYSSLLRGFVGARKHSEIEELSNKIRKTIALLEKEMKSEADFQRTST